MNRFYEWLWTDLNLMVQWEGKLVATNVKFHSRNTNVSKMTHFLFYFLFLSPVCHQVPCRLLGHGEEKAGAAVPLKQQREASELQSWPWLPTVSSVAPASAQGASFNKVTQPSGVCLEVKSWNLGSWDGTTFPGSEAEWVKWENTAALSAF